MPTLTPPVYLAIIEEAHKYNVPVAAHNVTLENAKQLMRAGVEGWVHLPVRGGEMPDDALLAIIREQVANHRSRSSAPARISGNSVKRVR